MQATQAPGSRLSGPRPRDRSSRRFPASPRWCLSCLQSHWILKCRQWLHCPRRHLGWWRACPRFQMIRQIRLLHRSRHCRQFPHCRRRRARHRCSLLHPCHPFPACRRLRQRRRLPSLHRRVSCRRLRLHRRSPLLHPSPYTRRLPSCRQFPRRRLLPCWRRQFPQHRPLLSCRRCQQRRRLQSCRQFPCYHRFPMIHRFHLNHPPGLRRLGCQSQPGRLRFPALDFPNRKLRRQREQR